MRQLVLALVIVGAIGISIVACGGNHRQQLQPLSRADRAELLNAREAVWRAWFNNDREALEAALPPELVALGWEGGDWENRDAVLDQAAEFAATGERLMDLRFPRTEIQAYGDVAILYTQYEVAFENDGGVSTRSGRATEVFVRRDGRWINPGWHLDSGS